MPIKPAAVSLLAAVGSASIGSAQPSSQARAALAPGEGVLCLWAYASAAAEVGRRCRPGQNRALQDELERAVERIDAYVLRNSDFTPASVIQFKHEMGLVGQPEARVCAEDPLILYERIAARQAEFGASVAQMLSRPGRPTWGDCP